MGNSVLIDGMDENEFAKLTAFKSMKMVVEGGATAQYYLMIKNVVLVSKNPPEYLLLFFMDNLLTSPGFWTTGTTFVNRIDEIAGENETTLLEKAYLKTQNPINVFVNGNIPIFGERQNLKTKIDSHLKYTLPRLIDQCAKPCLDRNIELIFNFGNINRFPITPISLELDQWTGRNWQFASLVADSFLPDIIQLTRNKGIQLILVREKNARMMNLEDETDDMRLYFQDLAAYLEKEHIPLIDLSHHPLLTLDMFHDMMHFKPFTQPVFTRLVAEALLELLKK